MKKLLITSAIASAIVGSAALFHIGLPYTTIYQASNVIQNNDRSQIKALVKERFELVGIKSDIKDFMLRFMNIEISKMERDLAGNPFSGIGIGLAKIMLPTVIDNLLSEITPDYVANAIFTRAKSSNCRVEPVSFGNANYVCTDSAGKDIIALSAKSVGFTWKIVGLEVIDDRRFYDTMKK